MAVVGAVVASGLDTGDFAQASRAAWWIIAGCGAAVLAVGLATSGRWARGTAERTAATPAFQMP